jgi:hypothetical protein
MKTWGIIILALFALVAVGTWLIRIHNRGVARQRVGENYADFAAYFAEANIPDEILQTTYKYFQEWNSDSVVMFPVRATDNIYDIYGIVDEDLEDAVAEILKKSGRRFPTTSEIFQPPQIETVEDVVVYVTTAPAAK